MGTHYQAEFDKDEPIAAPTDGVGTSPESQTAQIKSFNKQTAQMSAFTYAFLLPVRVSGTVTASTTSAGELKFEWDLAGLEASINGLVGSRRGALSYWHSQSYGRSRQKR